MDQAVDSQSVLVLFSGGRDSTLSALRLAEQGHPLTLLTVVSGHLVGLGRVEQRINEIWDILPPRSSWGTVRQSMIESTPGLSPNTCLPCQRDYASVGSLVAKSLGIDSIAFGYTSYQSDWPEQTPEAIESLRHILSDFDLQLLLPVYNLQDKQEALEELRRRGVSQDSLEQKCLKQITNIKLSDSELKTQLSAWEEGLRSLLKAASRPKFHLNKTKIP